MTTLSDTPSRTILTSEPGGVSIKIEQGVFSKNDEYGGSKINGAMHDIAQVKHELNHPPVSENILNGMDVCSYNTFHITHSIFQPDFAIKVEPAVDIDDRQPGEQGEENTNVDLQSTILSTLTPPKIRLTPTNRLIGSPISTPDNKKRYVCTYENCTKSYGKSSHLRSHLTWHTGIKPFVCKEPGCGKGFTRSDELNRHIRTHTGEKPFECVRCTKKFSRSDHLTKHLATHTKQLSANNGALTKKIKMEKNVSLNILKSFPTIKPSAVSDNQFHNINFVETTASTSESLNIAPESLNIKLEPVENKGYNIVLTKQEKNVIPSSSIPVQSTDVANNLTVTVKPEPIEESHASESQEVSNEPDDDAIMPEANLPPLSQNSTITPSVMKDENPSFLKESFNNIADSVYDPTRPFPCCHCAKNFKRQDDLNRHMRTHTGEKPFACNECDKRFMRSDHLKKHLKTHTRIR